MDLKSPGSEPLSVASNNMVMYISCIFSGICFLLAAITLQLTVKVNINKLKHNFFSSNKHLIISYLIFSRIEQ